MLIIITVLGVFVGCMFVLLILWVAYVAGVTFEIQSMHRKELDDEITGEELREYLKSLDRQWWLPSSWDRHR